MGKRSGNPNLHKHSQQKGLGEFAVPQQSARRRQEFININDLGDSAERSGNPNLHKPFCLLMAAGSGTRAHLPYNKVLFQFGGCSILEHSLRAAAGACGDIIIVCSESDRAAVDEIAARYNARTVIGGATRTQSVRNGLNALRGQSPDSVVIVHDGARPFADTALFMEAIRTAHATCSAVAAIPCVDSLRQATDNGSKAVSRDGIYCVQTPQAFRLGMLLEAYDSVEGEFGDDAEVFERRWGEVTLIAGSRANTKITTSADLAQLAQGDHRIGNGYDIHRLEQGRRLILGGVPIPHDKGLLGHSDADVLVHALMDALLSAAGERDIGTHFSDNDPQYSGISSMVLLDRVMQILEQKGMSVVNVTAALIAERPRLSPFVPQMRAELAKALGLSPQSVGITVTTSERVGLVGREDAIACYCTALLNNQKQH